MTRYEKGFIEKCAEYGVDGRVLLTKIADPAMYGVKRPQPRDWKGRPMKPFTPVKDAIDTVKRSGGIIPFLRSRFSRGK